VELWRRSISTPRITRRESEIDYVNVYKHSSWLSLLENRLGLARDFLSAEGVLCVAIDDSEYHRLYGLLVEKFGNQEAVLGTISARSNPSGRSTVKGVSIAHDYAVFVAKAEAASVGRLARTEKQIARYKERDAKGSFEWVNFRKHGGAAANRSARPRLFYPIYVSQQGAIKVPDMKWDASKSQWIPLEKPEKNETVVYPINEKREEKRWKREHGSLLRPDGQHGCLHEIAYETRRHVASDMVG
jgi:adenine-specific DNA-methyltransferase